MRSNETSPESSSESTQVSEARQIQDRSTALDLASLAGSSASGLAPLNQALLAMRPESRLSDSMLPQLQIQDNSGQAIETRRPDGSMTRTYNTGARMELDSQGRMTRMQLPGPGGPIVDLTYEGNNRNPSTFTEINGRDKDGPQTIRAGNGVEIQANPSTGWISLSAPNDGRQLLISGEATRQFPNGSTSNTRFNPGDRSNVSTTVDTAGNIAWHDESRPDGSGYSASNGRLRETRFAPGTNLSYTDQNNTVWKFDVESISHSFDPQTGREEQVLRQRDGRSFSIENAQNLNGQRSAQLVRELLPGR